MYQPMLKPVSALIALAIALIVVGCESTPIMPGGTGLIPNGDGGSNIHQHSDRPTPDYKTTATKFNHSIRHLDQLWTRTRVKLRYLDEDDHERSESGEGKLIILPPDHVAMTIGKLAQTGMWAGCNSERFWLLDLMDDKRAFVGHHSMVGLPGSRSLPLPIAPIHVPHLLGLIPLDAESPGHVEWLADHLLVEPGDRPVRMLLDPKTHRPVRIDLLDRDGYSVIIALHSDPQRVEIDNLSSASWPRLAHRLHMYVVGEQAELRLSLTGATDGKAKGRIKPAVFDVDRLIRAHRIKDVVSLDPPGMAYR